MSACVSAPDKTEDFPRGQPRLHRQWRQIHHAITVTTWTSGNGGPTLQYRSHHTVALKPNHTEGAESLHMVYDTEPNEVEWTPNDFDFNFNVTQGQMS